MKSVYSAVRTGALNKAVCAFAIEGLISVALIQLWHIIPTLTYTLLPTTTWQILEFQNLKECLLKYRLALQFTVLF
jgi:hypothetical protein